MDDATLIGLLHELPFNQQYDLVRWLCQHNQRYIGDPFFHDWCIDNKDAIGQMFIKQAGVRV